MNYSLQMQVEQADDVWAVTAPWLDKPVYASTWHYAYWLALSLRPR